MNYIINKLINTNYFKSVCINTKVYVYLHGIIFKSYVELRNKVEN